MSNKKQSSVEWLEEQFNTIREQGNIEIEKLIWQQTKAMHKEEITDAYIDGHSTWGENTNAEQYYNETFGGNNES